MIGKSKQAWQVLRNSRAKKPTVIPKVTNNCYSAYLIVDYRVKKHCSVGKKIVEGLERLELFIESYIDGRGDSTRGH